MSVIQISPADPADARHTLRLSLASEHMSPVELERHVTAFLEYARAMSLQIDRQWTCSLDGQVTSACTCIESPGRTAMLLLPQDALGSAAVETRTRLVEAVVSAESERDVRLLQSLIRVNDDLNRQALEQAGFHEIAVLNYLELKLSDSRVTPRLAFQPSDGARWLHYAPDTHARFAELINASYVDGLDCPGLSDLRDIEDVLAGHKAAGRFDPSHWRLLLFEDTAVACVLLAENPLRPFLELVYMGVHPDFRRRSVGRTILYDSIFTARREGFQSMTLAVDANNAPARVMYEAAGFRETTRRRAMVRPL